jgi:hypothetical protein
VRNRTAALAVDLIESLFGKSTLIRRPASSRPTAKPVRELARVLGSTGGRVDSRRHP